MLAVPLRCGLFAAQEHQRSGGAPSGTQLQRPPEPGPERRVGLDPTQSSRGSTRPPKRGRLDLGSSLRIHPKRYRTQL